MKPRPLPHALLFTVLTVAACGAAAAAVPAKKAPAHTVPMTGPLYSEADAKARAAAELHLLHLPPGAVALRQAPDARLVAGNSTPGGAQTYVWRRRWWRVPGTAQGFSTYEEQHPPTGFKLTSGGWAGRDVTRQDFSGTHTIYPLPTSEYSVYALQAGTWVDVMAEVAVDVTPHRTALEWIPRTVATATLAYDRVPTGATGSTVHRHRALTAAEVQLLARGLNRLVPYPGLPTCEGVPLEEQQSTLKLTNGVHQVEFDISFGCDEVNVLVDGKQQPFLDQDDAVASLTLRLLHVKPIVYS